MAGLPHEVIARSKEVLANLEENELTPNKVPKKAKKRAASAKDRAQLSLFDRFPHPVVDEILKLDINTMTPLEALNRMDEWKRKLKDDPTW
jgi:DNA mismatch repair protein MutS